MGRIRSLPGICSQELPVITDTGVKLFMKPTSRRLTTHYTPRVCSSVTPAGFNLGTPTRPHWVYVDQFGNPYRGTVPRSFNFSQIARNGVDMPAIKGLYTDEQLQALQEQTSRGDAIVSINNHLVARILETKNNLFSYHTHLDQQLQQALESSTTPWPYSLINYIPHWIRVTFTAIFVTIFVGVFARPFYSLLLCIKNDSIGVIDLLYTICCGQAATLREHLRTNQAHLELAQRLDAATGEGEHDLLALTPIIDDSRLQAKVTDLQAQIEELRNLQDTRIKTLQKTITEARQATKTLDEMVKKQANQNKALEARLNRLEQKEPPTYTMSALSKSEKKK
jgi:hypothetical protein